MFGNVLSNALGYLPFCPLRGSINPFALVPILGVLAILLFIALILVVTGFRKKVFGGNAGMIGEIGDVTVSIDKGKVGKVYVHGEIWDAKSNYPIEKGTKVKIVKIDKMTVWVEESNSY
jgi:membrane-bound serine protease (ClpP class)